MSSQFIDKDFNNFAIKNVKVENLSSDPSGAGLYKGRIWFNSTTNKYMGYNGTAVVALDAGSHTARQFVGSFDAATAGAWPTSGSADDNSIQAGDEWFVTSDATLGAVEVHEGDQIIALVDDAGLDADFAVIHGETVDLSPYSREEVQTGVAFSAGVEKTITASNLSSIRDIEVLHDVNSDGTRFAKITSGVTVELDGVDATKVYVTVGQSLTGAKVVLQGTSN